MKLVTLLLFLILPGFVMAQQGLCPKPESLLIKMQGQWTANGEKTYTQTGKVQHIRATTASHIEEEHLHIRETQQITEPNGKKRIFTFNYWVRAAKNESCQEHYRVYEFGKGAIHGPARFYGKFNGQELLTTEELPGQRQYITYTEFLPQKSIATGRLLQNNTLVMTQQLTYKKQDSSTLQGDIR